MPTSSRCALWSDTDAIRKRGLIKDGWEERLPNHSLPYFSTIVFVVRKGNPKGIKDWPDIVKPDVVVITPNPKTSGNGKLSFLAAWGSVIQAGGSEAEAREFVTRLYRQTPVLETGARGATTTFAQRGIGDVHLTWENEAHLEVEESGGALEIVYPPRSIRAEPIVAVVDANVDRKGTRAVAEEYLKFLYTDAGQETIARHFYRPTNEAVLARHSDSFPEDRSVFDHGHRRRAGTPRSRNSSRTAACSTRSTGRSRPTVHSSDCAIPPERQRRPSKMLIAMPAAAGQGRCPISMQEEGPCKPSDRV